MSEAIVLTILTESGPYETIGMSFDIEGSKDKFVVHTPTESERLVEGIQWGASHVKTGMRFATGNTVDEVIRIATSRWRSKTSAEIAIILRKAMGIRKRILSGEKIAAVTP